MVTYREVYVRLEELLAMDDLFIEYFNDFLALPTFPEPLYFNKETGGFEVASRARLQIAQDIKRAVRSGRLRKSIYRHVHAHSFTEVPKIPIAQRPLVQDPEIKTLYTVKTLNKEQGIEWVKEERLPMFLESECYVEYRLAKLISQTCINHQQQLLTFNLDDLAQMAEIELGQEQERLQREREEMMRKMYVSMGEASTTDADAWVSQARIVAKVSPTSVTLSDALTAAPRVASASATRSGATSRPKSAATDGTATDSGAWSYADDTVSSVDPRDHSRAGSSSSRAPGSARTRFASRGACAVAPTDSSRPVWSASSQVAYSAPGGGDTEQLLTVCDNEDQLASVVTGTVLKYALADILCSTPGLMEEHPAVQNAYPDPRYARLSKDDINNLICTTKPNTPRMEQKVTFTSRSPSPLSSDTDEDKENMEDISSATIEGIQNECFALNSLTAPEKEDSDDESLVNSDDDYEPDRDWFFLRNRKVKQYSLLTKKGIQQFKHFLHRTRGEMNWNFWIDIDRARLIRDDYQLEMYISALRERYYNKGSLFEPGDKLLEQLQLTEASQWKRENLLQAQAAMIVPLIQYWAPRFKVSQQVAVTAYKNYLYTEQQHLSSSAHPEKKRACTTTATAETLLPLRPKSCVARIHAHTATTTPTTKAQLKITPAFDDLPTVTLPERCQSAGPRTRPITPCVRSYTPCTPHKPHTTTHTPYTHHTPPPSPRRQRARSAVITSTTERLAMKTPKEIVYRQRKRTHSASSVRSRTSSAVGQRDQETRRSSVASSHDSASTDNSVQSSIQSRDSMSVVSAATDESEFMGGRRHEALLHALINERKSGDFLRKYIQKTGNVLWDNALQLWIHIQEYHKLFYTDIKNEYNLTRKAQLINSRFLADSASCSVLCPEEIRDSVAYRLHIPYEDLFDDAEFHAVAVLYDAWTDMLLSDMQVFSKVALSRMKRQLKTKNKYTLKLRNRGIIREVEQTEEDDELNYEYSDPVYDPDLLERIPEQFRHFNLHMLMGNSIEREHFRQFLADNYAGIDLQCYIDMERFRRIPNAEDERRDQSARDIKTKYLNKKYFFGPNSPAGKKSQDKVMEAAGGWGKFLEDRPPTVMILEAQSYVRERVEKKWLPQFLATPEFASRQQPKSTLGDIVEDKMSQRRKHAHDLRKMLESEWVSASKEIVAFRRALMNPTTSQQFRKYVSVKGETLENDVLFWHEVQKYKEFCHQHSDRTLLQQKTFAIVNSFIDSPVPPNLQIDITQDMADDIVEKKKEVTPYLFREAQLAVFRVLFNYWKDFCTFRDKTTDDKILPTLERHHRQAQLKRIRQSKKEAARRAKEAEGEDEEKGEGGTEEGQGERDVFDIHEEELMMGNPDAVSWSYSKYLEAFESEDVLNSVDQNTFVETDNSSKMTDKATLTSNHSTTQDNSSAADARKRSRSRDYSGADQGGLGRITEASSLSDDVNAVERPPSGTRRRPTIVSAIGKPAHAQSAGDGETNGTHRRMSRTMPPLVQKR